jgi:ribosomal protein S18 acetylase RimI-like enzyme
MATDSRKDAKANRPESLNSRARLAGFSDEEPDSHDHMLYVHPDFQRRGIA